MAEAVDIFPNPVPSLANINTVLGNFTELIQIASRDKVQVELKRQSKFNLHRRSDGGWCKNIYYILEDKTEGLQPVPTFGLTLIN